MVFTYGNKTPAEIKIVLSAPVALRCVQRGWLDNVPQPIAPKTLFDVFVEREPKWREIMMQIAGFTDAEIDELNSLRD